MSRHVRRGITLFQLILVLAFLAILFALFLPAVLRLRVAAARAQSSNNLKQLMLACHNYNDTNGHFPPGCDDNNFSAAAYLLPYIEQDNVFKLIDFKKPSDDKANAQARGLVIKTFLDPRDSVMGGEAGAGGTNYLFCAGARYALDQNDGAFFLNSKSKLPQSFPDGTSNTVGIAETLKGNGNVKMTNVQRQYVLLGKDELKGLKEESGADDWKNGTNIAADRGGAWIDGRFLKGTFTATRKVNDQRPDFSCAGLGGLSGPRTTEAGAQVALCDGSVRFLNQSISLETLRALSTTAGGEVIGNDF